MSSPFFGRYSLHLHLRVKRKIAIIESATMMPIANIDIFFTIADVSIDSAPSNKRYLHVLRRITHEISGCDS